MGTDIESMKHQFASQLKKCLELHYGGRLRSISTIARDFSLKANHLPHVSGETVRKWLRAETIPQYPRVQSLADWLGPELLLPFENWHLNNRQSLNRHAQNGQTPHGDEIVMGDNVRISTVAIAQGNLTIRVQETPAVSQPNAFAQGQTTVTPQSTVSVDEEKGKQFITLRNGASLSSLVSGLNTLGVTPRDMISILQAIKAAGALQADIEVM